jgi:thiamine pyrophosphokinase
VPRPDTPAAPPGTAAVVVAGGPYASGRGAVVVDHEREVEAAAAALRGMPGDAWVVAADSGLDRARVLGLRVDHVVGDMDSVSPAALAAATAAGIAECHPESKDATDLDLAVDAALAGRPRRLVVIGSGGGRLDHLLAMVSLLAGPRLAGVAVEAALGQARVVVVRSQSRLWARPGELVSLLPVGGPAVGVTTEGLLYPLADEDLPAGSSRGVSNEVTEAPATVRLRDGVLVAVLPGEQGTHLDRGLGPGAKKSAPRR